MFAIFLACLLLVSTAQAQENPGVAVEAPTPEKTEEGQADGSPNPTLELSVPVRIIEDEVEAAHTQEREKKSDEHEAADLEAQQIAAEAASKSAASTERQEYLARWQLALSAAGIAALLYTLYLARTSNAVAQEAVAVSRDIGQRQLRAYVQAGDIIVKNFHPGQIPSLSFVARNFGQTPAFRYQHISTYRMVDHPNDAKVGFEGAKFRNARIDLPTGEATTKQGTILPLLPKDLYDAVINKEKFLIFYGIISYSDIFRQNRRVIFRHYLNVDKLEAGEAMLDVCSKHNRST